MKFTTTTKRCELYLTGDHLTVNCPLCGAYVNSGERHACEIVVKRTAPKPRPYDVNPGGPRSGKR